MGSNCCKCANDKKNKHLTSASSQSSGPWTRGDVELLGERFSSVTQRGAVTLNVRNATVDDSGRYSLSARNDAGHAHSDLLLEVRTRPGDVPVFLRRLNDLAVKVGTRTRFLVEIRSPTQVKVSWEQEGKPVVESERFHLLHEGNFFCVDVAPVTLGDAGLWICRAHNSNGTATCFCHLNVLVPKAYKAPHFIEELVAILTEQGTVSLECKVVGVPTPTLRWFKDNQEIKAGDVFALTANPQDTTSLGTYTCEATNCMGRAYSTSRVHVLSKEGGVQPVDSLVPKGPAPVFAKELRNDKVKIGGKLTLSCNVSVPPWPKSITWFNKAGLVENGGRYHIVEDGLGAYSVEVDPVEASDEGEWKCVATSTHGVKGISTCNVSVSYPKNYKKPKFLESLKAILTEEGLVSFECKVVGYPTPQLRWFKDGQELKPGDVYQLTGTNSLGSYCCIAKNCMGETSSTAELTVEDIQSQLNEEERLQLFSKNQPPRFLQGLKSLDAKIMDPLRLTVQVSVSPQPSVAWFRDDEEVQESDRYKKEEETKGFCHLSIKRLELLDQAEWKCVATNDYGQSVTSCFLKLTVPRHYKKPRFLENLRAVLSEEGAVNLECKVIGVPQPTLKWYKDGRELKPGDIHRIISGQDGTCCLGTYTCEASNCMGTVSSSASLLGFEDRAQVKPQPEPLRPLPPPAAHLTRHPSLSTIQEERTSQLHDTVATDERAEVSFSFDGKEVSVSLYETPDLTEEEALQVVEMYAEELSEHISGLQEVKSLEHNVVELPPMRFVKETSQSGHLLMEAVVIDVSPEYYASAEDRTEADLDEFSITEDNGFMSPQVLTPEEMPFDKFTTDFLERTTQLGQKAVPVKPPRKRGADNSESSYHSVKEAKLSPEEESSEFADALSSIKDKSQKDSFSSAKMEEVGAGGKPPGKIEAAEESRKEDDIVKEKDKEKDVKLGENKKPRKKSRSRSRSTEIQVGETVSDAASENKVPKRPLKKRKSTDSEKEDDSLQEFERQKSLKAERDQDVDIKNVERKETIKKCKSSESEKEDDSLQEFESRKSSHKTDKSSDIKTDTKSKKLQKKQLSDSSGKEDDSLIEYEKKKIASETSEKLLKSEKQDRQKAPLSKSISTDSSEKDEAFAIKSDQSEQSRKRKKRSIKKSGSTEKKTDTPETGVEIPPSSEAESCDHESLKNKKVVSSSDLDRMRSTSDLDSIGDKSRAQEEEEHSADFDTAEDSAYDKSEMSVLESLTHSLKEIKKGLAAVEERVISESTDEPQSAKSSLSAIESLVQPINEIQRGLIEVEKQAEETEAGQYSPSSILEALKEPIQELGRNLVEIEKAKTSESEEELLLKRTSQTLLETVSHPLQELQKELNFIQQQAIIETGEETYSDVLQSFKPSLLVVQGGLEQTEGDFTSKLEDLTDITVLPQGTYAQQVEQTLSSNKESRDPEVISTKQHDLLVPLTVLDVEESLAETADSLTTLGAIDLHRELGVISEKLKICLKDLNTNAEGTSDGEIKDILMSLGKLVTPLDQFKHVIEKCLRLVAENDKSNDPQVRSSNMVLKATLESPVHSLGKCLNLLETVANTKSSKEIRGLGIKILYKLSFPLEELKTTMKLIENLSEHTSIELLVTPVENLISAASVINLEASKSGFAENISEEGGFIVKELDGTVRSLSESVASITKNIPSQSSLSALTSLTKSLADFQKKLYKLENKIKTPEKYNTVTTSEIYNLAQDLCKPLQSIRTELSIAQHEIELDQYSHLSMSCDPIQDNPLEFATNIIYQSLEQVHKSVLTCTEFVLSRSPSETLYIRYLLFALNELILPLNQLNMSVAKANETLSKASNIAQPNIGISAVSSSASDLLSVLSQLRHHSITAVGHPEIQLTELLCTMEEPLFQVERGLCKIIEHNHEEDKNVLNINLLKTLAEPFKCLQKSLININEKLCSEAVPHRLFLELKHPIQELQRSILIIQDQVSFEYGDEPASIESNIVTLQSLVHPLNALRKQFMELDDLMIDRTQSTSYSKENKNLHSIIKVSHEIQLKLSSIMVEENYLNKHSLDSLDMFPIFQDLASLLKEFENSLKRVDLVCSNESKADIVVYNKLCESVKMFTQEASNFHNKISLASNKAISDVKHPVHFLKRGTEKFIQQFSEIATDLENCELDEPSLISSSFTFYRQMLQNFNEFSEFVKDMDKLSNEIERDSTEITALSSSDTIKDVNTITEEVTQTKVFFESGSIPPTNKTTLGKQNKENKDTVTVRSEETQPVSSYLERFEKSASDLELGLMKLEHALLNSTGDFSSLKNIDIDVLAHPIEELVCYINSIEEQQTAFDSSETLADQSSLSMLKTLAHPIREIQEGVLLIQEHIALEASGKTPSGKSCAGILYEIAKPIRELRSGVALIQEQMVMEPDVEPLSEETMASSLKTFAVPIEEMKKVLTTITEQQPLLFEADVQSMSENISLLKTIAQPVKELQNKLASIEINQVMESGVEPFSVKQEILSLAKPVQTLQEGIALVESQLALETIGSDLSLQSSVSMLKTLAKPLLEISKGIAIIFEEQFIEDGHLENISSMSELSTLANVTDISLADAAVHVGETVTLEHGLSFRDDTILPQLADSAIEENRHIGIIEQQQVLLNVDSQNENKECSIKYESINPDNSTLVIQEVISSLQVQEQETLSQANTLTISEDKTLHVAKLTEESLNVGVQAEIQDPIIHIDKLLAEKRDQGIAVEKEVSLNIAAQVVVQETLSNVKAISSVEELPITDIETNTVTPCIVQGELQQSLADVDSLETEEETLESLSIQDVSFKFEPQINDIQEALSNVGELLLTEKTLCEAVIKTGTKEAIQNETLQALDKEAPLKSLDMNSEEANLSVNTPNIAAETELNQIISNLDDMKTSKYPNDSANVGEVSLEIALQVECQELLSNVETLKTESISEKCSQAMALEENVINVAIKTQVQEYFSAVEQIEEVKNELQVKFTHEPLISEVAKKEIQQVLQIAEEVISRKEAIQASIIQNPGVNVELPDMKQVLVTCEKVKQVKDTVQDITQDHSESEKRTGDNMSLAKKLDGPTESLPEKSKTDLVNTKSLINESSDKVFEDEPVSISPVQLDSKVQDEHLPSGSVHLLEKDLLAKELVLNQAIESQIDNFITVIDTVTDSVHSLEAKIISDPAMNYAVQQQCQEMLSTLNEIKTIKETIQASEKREKSIMLASEVEVQQVLLACNCFEKLKELAEATLTKELKMCHAVESELQQILSAAGTFQTIKECLVPSITETENTAGLDGLASVKVQNVLSSKASAKEKESTNSEVSKAESEQIVDKLKDTLNKFKDTTKTEEKEEKDSKEMHHIDKIKTKNKEETPKLINQDEMMASRTSKEDVGTKNDTSVTEIIDQKDEKINDKEKESDPNIKTLSKPVKEEVGTKTVDSKPVSIEHVKTEAIGKDLQDKNIPSPEVEVKSESKLIEDTYKTTDNIEVEKTKGTINREKEKEMAPEYETETKVKVGNEKVLPGVTEGQEGNTTVVKVIKNIDSEKLSDTKLTSEEEVNKINSETVKNTEDKIVTKKGDGVSTKTKQTVETEGVDINTNKATETNLTKERSKADISTKVVENVSNKEICDIKDDTKKTIDTEVKEGKDHTEKLEVQQKSKEVTTGVEAKTLELDAKEEKITQDKENASIETKSPTELLPSDSHVPKSQINEIKNTESSTDITHKKQGDKIKEKLEEKEIKSSEEKGLQKHEVKETEEHGDLKKQSLKTENKELISEKEITVTLKEDKLSQEKGDTKDPKKRDSEQKNKKEKNEIKEKEEIKEESADDLNNLRALKDDVKDNKRTSLKDKEPQIHEVKGVEEHAELMKLSSDVKDKVEKEEETSCSEKEVLVKEDQLIQDKSEVKDGKNRETKQVKSKADLSAKVEEKATKKEAKKVDISDDTKRELHKISDDQVEAISDSKAAKENQTVTLKEVKGVSEKDCKEEDKSIITTKVTEEKEIELKAANLSKEVEKRDKLGVNLQESLQDKSKTTAVEDKSKIIVTDKELDEKENDVKSDSNIAKKEGGYSKKSEEGKEEQTEINKLDEKVKLTNEKSEGNMKKVNRRTSSEELANEIELTKKEGINEVKEEAKPKITKEKEKTPIKEKGSHDQNEDKEDATSDIKKVQIEDIRNKKEPKKPEPEVNKKSDIKKGKKEDEVKTKEDVKTIEENMDMKSKPTEVKESILKEDKTPLDQNEFEEDTKSDTKNVKVGDISNEEQQKKPEPKVDKKSDVKKGITEDKIKTKEDEKNVGENKAVKSKLTKVKESVSKKDSETLDEEKDKDSTKSDIKNVQVDEISSEKEQKKPKPTVDKTSDAKKGKTEDEAKVGVKTVGENKERKLEGKINNISETEIKKIEDSGKITKSESDRHTDKKDVEILDSVSSLNETKPEKDIVVEKDGRAFENKVDNKVKKTEENLSKSKTNNSRKTVKAVEIEENLQIKNKDDIQNKSSLNKTGSNENEEVVSRNISLKKQKAKSSLDEINKDVQQKQTTTHSDVKETLFIVEKEENKQKIYLDESSTSDYGSESYSEPHQIKKSQSYDTRQWVYDSKCKGDEVAARVSSKHIRERKYEVTRLADNEKSSYTSRQSASKPLFCGRLVDRTAAQGSKLKVTCSLTGSPDPTVQWFKDGHPVDTSVDHRIRTRLSNGLASLEIVDAKVGDSGKYTCTARNSHGDATTTAHIKVFSYMESAPEAPVFTQHIRDHYKSTADELVVECRVKGHPAPTVVWTKDGQPLRAVARYQQSVLTDGTCRLVIHGPEPSDSGLYRCEAENSVWSEQTSAQVVFEGREKYIADSRSLTDPKLPRFTNIVSDTVVREGGTVALQVAVKGTPRAEVTWYRGSEALPKRSSRFRYLEDAGVYSLVMTEASIREAGTYTCRASNAYGYRDTSVNVEIVGASGASGPVRGKPAMFLSRPDTSMAIAVGEDVSFSFRVSGDPKPRVTWMKGMKDITNNIRTMKETVNDYVRLTLKHATIMDAGTYFIMAKNIYGADHAFVTVRVKQRARSLTPTRTTIWSGPDTSTILRDIHESARALVNDVPGPISSPPVVSDCGKNWLSLSWAKPEHRGAAPVLAYKVEAWLVGTEGGAQWNELGVTPINSFDVFFLKPGSEYQFRVTARNRYGWGESVTTTEPITVGNVADFPPDIVRDLPGPLKALQGDSVTLECEINGDPPPTIQWLKDGHNVGTLATLKDRVFVTDDQLIHRLIIKQLTEDDSGRYVCEAVNKIGRASTYARLLVVTDPRLLDADRKLKESLLEQQESAPQFTMRLRDRRVQASYPVRLSCQVIGSPTPDVTWACQGQPITADDRHQIVQEADHFHTLEICRALLEDSGEYTATAQNCLGAVSCHCQLIVDKGIRAYISPEFTSELSPAVTAREGAELRLFAQVEAYPTVSISWQRDGVRLRPSRRLVMTLDPEGRVELALAHLTVRDAGLYTCTATNAVGRAETVCQVFVTGGTPVAAEVPAITTSDVPYSREPRFVTKPRSSEAVEGDTVVITCEVVGDPQPEVMWLRDWLKPGYYRDAPQFRQVGVGGGSQYSLEIPQVKLDFTGTYCVIARNTHGEAKAIISLQIYAKGQGKESSMVSGHVKHGQVQTLPEIKRELRDVRCCDGDAVTLECLVSATPLPSVRWEKDGKILPLGEDIEAELEGEVARLIIKKVYPEDEGQYSCVAYNDLGRAVTSACLVVDVPEEKETLLSQQLTRPPGLLSSRSTPRSTPRNTPSPARSLSPTPARYREFSSPSFSRPKRVKMSSPKFYTVPHNRIAEEGETVRFQCSVAGHPTPWASWDKDGHIVTPSSRLTVTERDDLRTLELREVTVEDAGLYRVTLENEMGSVEATARLDIIGRQGSRTRSVRAWSAVRSSPTFGRRLVGSAARVGGTFTLTCDVHASPSPVTSWYRNGEMLVKSPRVVPTWDGRRARLELRGLQPEDAGVYTCVAENAVGTTQCSAELRVLQTTDPSDADLQPPVFLQGLPPEQTAAEGQPFELQVRLQGSSPLEVVWVKDGVEVPDCPDLRHVDYGDGRFGLRIADVFTADGGIYNCEAFNDHGDAITSGHLIVNDLSGGESGSTEPEIMFTKTPSPVLARLRGQASFCARLQSRPLSHTSFSWTVNGRSVNNNDRFTVTTEEDCSILHVAEVSPSDMGPVVCTARVCSPAVPPTTVSCDTTLGLDPSPGAPAELLRGPCDTTAMRGDRVLLKATYRGDPEPNVRWLKAGRELSSEGRVQITSRDGVSCLTISAIDADDSGKYVVSVENIHGADCHFASVAVEGPPEAPAARPSVSLAGEGCVTVAWSSPPYDGGCVITGYRVEMRTAVSQQWNVVADRCHSLSHVVRGLTPGQTYLFRVRAENIHGASDSSAESFPFMLQSPHADLREEEGEGEGEMEPDEILEPKLVTLEPGDQFLQRYSVHEELGKGRYGVVHKVTDLRTGHTMAAKFVRCIKKQDREKVQEEIDIMNCLRHPKLLQLAAAFDNPKDMVMVMEYISGGELFERVVADDFTLTERDCILFLRQICEGVRYMHTCHVVHLDLKPENIMCHTRTSHRVKIIDFGLAQKLATNTPVRVLFGTPEFIPPEIINYEPIGVESDMWSVGVICYVLLSGLSPFMGDNDAETFANITRADFDFDDEAFEAISQDAKDFISSLLIKRKEKRLTAEECLKHKWLTQSDTAMSSVKLCTDKLKKFIIRRKWQRPPRNERQIA